MKILFPLLFLALTACTKSLTKQYSVAGVAYGSFLDGFLHQPDHQYIRYVGKWEGQRSSAPGAYFTTRFNGVLCKVILNNQGENFVVVVIDGDATRYRLHPGQNVIAYSGLAESFHTLTVVKETENQVGWIENEGIIVQGLQPYAAPSGRVIEYIGDSQTSGSGMVGPCETNDFAEMQDAYNGFGPLTSRALSADWILSSVSGIGLTQSYHGGPTMIPVYPSLNSGTVPDVVVVCLGQNDGVANLYTFARTYHWFLNTLRGKYPAAEIVLLNSPMGSGAANLLRKGVLENIVLERGDPHLSTLTLNRAYWHGCLGHPAAWEHILIAAELTDYLSERLHWMN